MPILINEREGFGHLGSGEGKPGKILEMEKEGGDKKSSLKIRALSGLKIKNTTAHERKV